MRRPLPRIVNDIANPASAIASEFKHLIAFPSAKSTGFATCGLAAPAHIAVGGVLVRLFGRIG